MGELQAVASVIEKVEVFRSHALITRRGKFQTPAQAGMVGLRFVGLPLHLEDSSIRARLLDEGRSRIVDLHLEFDFGERKGSKRTEGEEKLLALERKQAGVLLELQREQERVSFLRSLSPAQHAVEDLPERLAFEPRNPLKNALDLSAFSHPESISAQKRVRELDQMLRELDDQLASIRDDLRKESEAEQDRLRVCKKAARLQVECEQAGRSERIEVSYLVPSACWFPQYELRVQSDRDSAELVLMALVAQRSGEDWPRSELSLSTADLKRSAQLPELDSWRIGKSQPRRSTGWKELPDTLGELFEGYDRGLRQLSQLPAPMVADLPTASALVLTKSRFQGEDQLVSSDLRETVATRFAPGGAPAAKGTVSKRAAKEMSAAQMCEKPLGGMAAAACPSPAAPPPPPAMSRKRRSMPPEAEMEQLLPSSVCVAAERADDLDRRGAEEGPCSPAQLREEDSYGAAFAEEPTAVSVAAGEEALGYQNLRMVGVDDRELRGQLRATGLVDQLAEQLAALSPASAKEIRKLPRSALLGLFAPGPDRLDELNAPIHIVPVEASAGHFAVRYRADSPAEVLADGQLHALTLLRRSGAISRVFRCVPAQDPQVYQLAVFQNPLQLPLLAGPVKVYREGDFIVDAPLETTPPGKPITVNLGVEPSLAVARNTHFGESTEGLLGGATVLTHTIEIEVNSKLLVPVRLELFERVPVSFEEDLKVTLQSSTPKAESYDQTDRGTPIHGGYRFTVDLGPKEKRNCTLVYRIVIPSKKTLVGGNRRD